MAIKYIGHIKYDDILYDSPGIVICGAGRMVNKIIQQLTEMKLIARVKVIADNDSSKYNLCIHGVEVKSYSEVVKNYLECDYVIYNDYARDIFEQLLEYDVKRIHLIREL